MESYPPPNDAGGAKSALGTKLAQVLQSIPRDRVRNAMRTNQSRPAAILDKSEGSIFAMPRNMEAFHCFPAAHSPTSL